MTEKLILWQPLELEVIPASANSVSEIAPYAIQLAEKDREQIVSALTQGFYEMGVGHLWARAMSALKRELGQLGSEFLGEMLGRTDISENDNPQDILTDKDALRLAEELGIISSVESLRLRQTQELITHLRQRDPLASEVPNEEMDGIEAVRAFKACVKNILGKPKIEVAAKFVELRDELLGQQMSETSPSVALLHASPYFFRKLSLNILLSAIRSTKGASLEISLANLNALLPSLWEGFREPEKQQVGRAYSEVYAAGLSVPTQGLKKALLKVGGFDFVPESLRSESFIKAAEEILKAHDGFDNFYNELPPTRTLEAMGSVIPAHALTFCVTALLAVKLGNQYGSSNGAAPIADSMMDKLNADRWSFYLNQGFPGDIRILEKLSYNLPRQKWIALVKKHNFASLTIKNKHVKQLIEASLTANHTGIQEHQQKLLSDYYGRKGA